MIMTWISDVSERKVAMIERYANIMGQVGLSYFTVNKNGYITGSVPTKISNIIPKYPKVNWLLTIKNLNKDSEVVEVLLNNANAKKTFFSELQRLIDAYPKCKGIDIALENCGGYDNQIPMRKLILEIYSWCQSKKKMLNVCLPPITAPHESINGEYWCAYEDYKDIVDTVAIMSYYSNQFRNTPGPNPSRGWVEKVLEYATSVVAKEKILIGIEAGSYMWGLHQSYKDNEAVKGDYYWSLFWMQGKYNFFDFKDDGGLPLFDRQAKIPFTGYWNDYEKACYMLPHVYDYVDGNMHDSIQSPMINESQDGRSYVVGNTKFQKISGPYDVVTQYENIQGAVITGDGYIASESPQGEWEYVFTVPSLGIYTLALDMVFPWFDNNAIKIKLDGLIDCSKVENRFWNPTFRTRHLEIFYEGYLTKGTHTIKCGAYDSIVGATTFGLYYGKFDVEMFAGQADYKMSTQEFIDVNGDKVVPADNYAMTVETLRTPPDSASIWYEDYKSYSLEGPNYYSDFWDTSGAFEIIENEDSKKLRLNGTSVLKETNWNDVHIFAMWQEGSGRVGVTFGNLFACMNYSDSQLQLWNGSTLIHAIPFDMKEEQAIAMRVRENSIRVYAGINKELQFTIEISTSSGSPGIRSTSDVDFTLCRIGSGWWYEPHECYEITVDGETTKLGRVKRNDVTWDEELQMFKVDEDVQESATRTEELNSNYSYQYLGKMPNLKGKEYQDILVSYKPIDVNIKHMRTYIGDSDGFGIMHYRDADALQHWYNEALFKHGIKGIALGSLGQEDCRIWERITNKEE